MLESSRSYMIKTDRIITPMFNGNSSGRAIKISYDFARKYKSELTAVTIRDKTDANVLDRLNTLTSLHNDGKRDGIKVIPKIITSDDVKTGLLNETSEHYYDLMVLSTRKRSVLSSSIFGSIGDFILKNITMPSAIISSGNKYYPYKKILLPVSESINSRFAVMFAYKLAAINNSELEIMDLRKYDKKPLHGFKLLFDKPYDFFEYNINVNFIKTGNKTGIKEEIDSYIKSEEPQCLVLGINSARRINSDLKFLIKDPDVDTIMLKK